AIGLARLGACRKVKSKSAPVIPASFPNACFRATTRGERAADDIRFWINHLLLPIRAAGERRHWPHRTRITGAVFSPRAATGSVNVRPWGVKRYAQPEFLPSLIVWSLQMN